jgi:futalosine hydrolase
MRILIVSATILEIKPLLVDFIKLEDDLFELKRSKELSIQILISGVGLVAMAARLAKRLEEEAYDFVLNCGIAGSFDSQIPLTKLFLVEQDTIADLGVEMGQKFISISQLGLAKDSDISILRNSGSFNRFFETLPVAYAISKNTGSGRVSTISFLQRQFKVQLESMEGAAFHFVCRQKGVPFCQVRAVSNYVGERDKSKWDIKGSVTVLNEFVLKSFIEKL